MFHDGAANVTEVAFLTWNVHLPAPSLTPPCAGRWCFHSEDLSRHQTECADLTRAHTHTHSHACISTRPPSCIICDDFRAISAFGLSSLLLRKVGARRVGCVYSRGSPVPPLTFPVKKSTFLLGGDRTPERNDRSESRGSQARRPPARARPRGCGAKGWKTVYFEG